MKKLTLALTLVLACGNSVEDQDPTAECITMEGGAYSMRLLCDNGVDETTTWVADGPLRPELSSEEYCTPPDGFDTCSDYFDPDSCTYQLSATGPDGSGYFELRPTSPVTAVGVFEWPGVSCRVSLVKRK